MIARYLSSAAAGLAVTTALLWVMNTLIEVSEGAVTPSIERATLAFLPTIDDTEAVVDDFRPEPVDDPVDPPPLIAPTDDANETGLPVIDIGVPTPDQTTIAKQSIGFSDGSLINIIHTTPEYPIALSQRGIEGFVIVSFDVTALGTVENVQVIESSHRGFNKAAVKAAYRSRYKARVVDGEPLPTAGLRMSYRFELDE